MVKKLLTALAVLVLLTSICTFAKEPNVDFGPYMREMQRKVKLNWNPPEEQTSKSVILTYEIKKSGEIVNIAVLESSSSEELDNSAIEALKTTSPLRPLPAGFNEDSVKVQFSFDYNVRN